MGTFATQLSGFAANTDQKFDRVLRRCALDVLRRVVVRSPVDTGRFRGNWQAGVDLPSGAVDDKDKQGDKTIKSGADNISDVKIGTPVFIVNNLPYAVPLENGHSQQAPAGMVGVTVAEWPGILKDAVDAIK